MVRLLLVLMQDCRDPVIGFNPTMVRLLQVGCTVCDDRSDGFNPTMVRLLLVIDWSLIAEELGFNPTMVRLLLAKNLSQRELVLFQSHNGAIAAFLTDKEQFKTLLVSIPQWCDCC